jgi:hypothetical protein
MELRLREADLAMLGLGSCSGKPWESRGPQSKKGSGARGATDSLPVVIAGDIHGVLNGGRYLANAGRGVGGTNGDL